MAIARSPEGDSGAIQRFVAIEHEAAEVARVKRYLN